MKNAKCTHDFLSLTLVEIQPGEQWNHTGQGLCFAFPRKGTGKLVNRSRAFVFVPGDVLVISPSLNGVISACNNQAVGFACFFLELEHVFPLLGSAEVSKIQSLAAIFKDARLYQAGSHVAAECHRLLQDLPAQPGLTHRAHLLNLASTVLGVELTQLKVSQFGCLPTEDRMAHVFSCLPVDDMVSLSATELADKFGCSSRHLNRLFHRYLGLSVTALRMEIRLIRAMALLRDPNAKVIHVAEQCGFHHLGLFNTCFKRRFGHSPGQWRKRVVKQKGGVTELFADTPACPRRANNLCPWQTAVAASAA